MLPEYIASLEIILKEYRDNLSSELVEDIIIGIDKAKRAKNKDELITEIMQLMLLASVYLEIYEHRKDD